MLHRPYIRQAVRKEVEERAPKNEEGQYLDANTGKPIEGSYDLGHVRGHEFRTEKAIAEKEGLTQAQFNDKMNNPDLYQIEDPSTNRSHIYEEHETKEEVKENKETKNESVEEKTVETENEMEVETSTEAKSAAETEGLSEAETDNASESTSVKVSESNVESQADTSGEGEGEGEGQGM